MRSLGMFAAALIGVAFAGNTAACARPPATTPPTHEALVTDHMQGNYAAVLRWCPMILADRGADPAQSNWCLFGYPAALRLTLDTEQALKFIGRVCTDTGSAALADPGFRTSYVREVARWYALPMRLQRQDRALARGLPATVAAFSGACQVDPVLVSTGLDTALPTRRLAR